MTVSSVEPSPARPTPPAPGQVQVAVGVEDDVATHVAANPAVDRRFFDFTVPTPG
ncbi:MAG TPA: hypothetical protein VFR74_05565 [Jiangellales bacterium]|nr:hypothetical protein [Jiangellales bacterium]